MRGLLGLWSCTFICNVLDISGCKSFGYSNDSHWDDPRKLIKTHPSSCRRRHPQRLLKSAPTSKCHDIHTHTVLVDLHVRLQSFKMTASSVLECFFGGYFKRQQWDAWTHTNTLLFHLYCNPVDACRCLQRPRPVMLTVMTSIREEGTSTLSVVDELLMTTF